jgi:ribose 5-phosphate isomerase RpiB
MKILKIKKLKIKKTIWNLLFAYMNVRIQMKLKKSVTKFLKKKGISMFIKKNIQERNNLYVKFVKNVLLQMGI